MMTKPLRLAILVSCSASSRTGTMIAEWLYEIASDLNLFDVDMLNLAEWELPSIPMIKPAPAVQEVAQHLNERSEEADAFLVVTPECNRSFPTLLKITIEWNHTQGQRSRWASYCTVDAPTDSRHRTTAKGIGELHAVIAGESVQRVSSQSRTAVIPPLPVNS